MHVHVRCVLSSSNSQWPLLHGRLIRYPQVRLAISRCVCRLADVGCRFRIHIQYTCAWVCAELAIVWQHVEALLVVAEKSIGLGRLGNQFAARTGKSINASLRSSGCASSAAFFALCEAHKLVVLSNHMGGEMTVSLAPERATLERHGSAESKVLYKSEHAHTCMHMHMCYVL